MNHKLSLRSLALVKCNYKRRRPYTFRGGHCSLRWPHTNCTRKARIDNSRWQHTIARRLETDQCFTK